MKNKNILWFCKSNDSSSLSRITDSVIPILKKDIDITLLSNDTKLSGIKHIKLGADTEYITYANFMKGFKHEKDIQSINIKYIIVQIVDLIYTGNFDCLFICNGIYEIDYLVKTLMESRSYLMNKNNKRTKLVVWSPIDYIPSPQVIEIVIKADTFITMNPVIADEISKLTNKHIEWVGHGSEIYPNNVQLTKRELITRINNSNASVYYKTPIFETDIIILNANNCIDRKRLVTCIRAFLKVRESINSSPKIKLWIHTNLETFFKMLNTEKIKFLDISDDIILSNNNISSEILSYVYKLSDITLQTSTGEGWSLTNMESALYKSLQVVPDFLACGYHFKNRGLLIPVREKVVQNEAGHDVIIGEVSVEDTALKLQEAIELIIQCPDTLESILNNAYEYSKGYTWESITDKLLGLLNEV